jgi:hypothetical protein
MIDQEQKLLQELERGQQATELMEHPLMLEAFSTIRESYLTQWENSPARDTEGREKIWTYLKQLETLRSQMTTVMQTGRMAQEQRSLMERMKAGARSLTGSRT